MKIALLTIWHCGNYGAELQTYATVRKLHDLGHDVVVIDYRLENSVKRSSLIGRLLDFSHDCAPVSLKFKDFWARYIPSTRQYMSLDELRINPPQADLYLVGSDQVWNPQITGEKSPAYFLNFVPNGAKMASYASSFGTDQWLGDPALTEIVIRQLNKFKGLSCREQQGCTLLKERFLLDAIHVLDPSLLHNSYPELTGTIQPQKTLAYYQLSESTALKVFARRKADEMGLNFIDVNHHSQLTPTFTWNRRSVGQWIRAIAESQFVITQSFHGLAMCLLYHRPFVVVYEKGNRVSRMASLLQMVGLEERLFTSIDAAEASKVWNTPIDYQHVDEVLSINRDFSINYLRRITTV